MAILKDLFVVTKHLYDHTNVTPADDERDTYLEKVEELLEQRKDLIEQITSPRNDAEKKLFEEMMTMNQVIQERLEGSITDLKKQMTDTRKKRQHGRKYEMPYERRTLDGVFLIRKNDSTFFLSIFLMLDDIRIEVLYGIKRKRERMIIWIVVCA
ncbi:hypothetical protein D7Z54_00590 [Salibacterium salarium]|uniref:Flagellar protein FliT n=1 Tax=Salibacterium salarium TaxID=284579 RepID=A0A3R9PAN2_9BACI|nr:hypothetical protein [Salibacterium salarium]RSL35105.1 hypothetical protein D7Z54_00590 [Salibacterium salarium]